MASRDTCIRSQALLLGHIAPAQPEDNTTPNRCLISQHKSTIPVQYISRVLHVPHTAAFAIAATAASTILEYASLMREDANQQSKRIILKLLP